MPFVPVSIIALTLKPEGSVSCESSGTKWVTEWMTLLHEPAQMLTTLDFLCWLLMSYLKNNSSHLLRTP